MGLLLVALAYLSATSPWPVVSARAEAKYLAPAIHREVTVPNSLADHMLYVRHDASRPDIELNAVAAALRARVQTVPNVFALVRTEADDRHYLDVWASGRAKWIEERVRRAERYRRDYRADEDPASALRQAIEIWQTAMDHLGDPTRNDGAVEANTCQLNPSGRVMIDAIRTLGVPTIARLPVRTATVFETDPRGDARPLPNFGPSVQRYEDLLVPLQSFKRPANMVFPIETTGMLTGLGQPAIPLAGARLSVSPHQGFMLISLEGFDAQGNLVANDAFTVSAENHDVTGPETVAKAAMSVPDAKRVSLPTLLIALAQDQPVVGIPRWLQKPTECEPLSVYASFAMDQLVGSNANCAAVDMCDDLVQDAFVSQEGAQLNLDAFERVLEGFDPYERVEGNGFVALRPVDPIAGGTLDRKDLQEFVGSALDGGYIDMRALAKAGDPASNLLSLCLGRLMRVTTTNVDGTGFQVPHLGVLGLIRGIGDQDWSALMSGSSETAGQLGVTKELLAAFDQIGLFTDSKSSPPRYRHPAELYSNGQFDQTPIRIVIHSEPVFRMTDSSAHRWTRWDPQSGGIFQLSLRAHVVGGVPQVDTSRDQFESMCETRYRFQTGVRNLAKFQIVLPAGDTITSPMPRPIDGISSELTYSDLPKDLRDRTWEMVVQRALANAR